MDLWGSIIVAVTTAIVTIGGTELARWLRRRSDDRSRSADWDITYLPVTRGVPGRIAVVTNIGDAEALDVDFTITGDAEYDFHPDARLDRCRPRDCFLVHITNVGTGMNRIAWTDRRGFRHGPVDRFTTP